MPQLRARHPHRLGDLALGRAQRRAASATAWNPTISERGNGQAWLPR
jgi:hypothetical protein